ncbi:MAG: helix-turn-helix transcriptional regulator [Caulobacterales bacterium]|nr:helix-turn-helix transcriptional regulator [Caulobacterales bacterium]
MLDKPTPLGETLKRWREQRALSQLELSLRAEVSTRHLSFVETGRAAPGRDLLLRLADELAIPLRERNTILVAAGFAPVFAHRRFSDPEFDAVRTIIDRTLANAWPFPAYVIDRHWNVVASNAAIPELFEGARADLAERPVNVVRLMLHPEGMAPRIRNLAVWRAHYLHALHRQLQFSTDPVLERLLAEVLAYPDASPADDTPQGGGLAVPLEVETRLGRLSFLSATTVFGEPLDVTLEEIAVEQLYPADDATDRAVRAAAPPRAG